MLYLFYPFPCQFVRSGSQYVVACAASDQPQEGDQEIDGLDTDERYDDPA
jgi:hypothetical protein